MHQEHESRAQRKSAVPTVSRVCDDGSLIELIYDPEKRSTAFSVFKNGTCTIESDLELHSGERIAPFSPENNLIKNEVVLLPSQPLEYGSPADLMEEIQAFIHRYADLSPSFEKVAAYYVSLTWLYDAFNEMPYLRLRGDFGTGKTRTLLTIGSLCYKAFFASGASTVSPIFHILNIFGGTLVFDEADFRFSDERAEIIKVLNNGNVKGIPVLRTMINRQREFNPQAFHVFGPKIVATRGNYEDKGLESRFITEEMSPRKLRADIPINLPLSFKSEARALRNRLLLYRFRHRIDAKIDESLLNPDLEPRLNQILMPLLSVVRDETVQKEMKAVAANAQARLIGERGDTVESHILEMLSELMVSSERPAVPVGAVTVAVVERYGHDYTRTITNRWIGGIIRKRLGLQTYKSHGIYVVPRGEYEKIKILCQRYGIEPQEQWATPLAKPGLGGHGDEESSKHAM